MTGRAKISVIALKPDTFGRRNCQEFIVYCKYKVVGSNPTCGFDAAVAQW